MSALVPQMDQTNLICPDCGYQVTRTELRSFRIDLDSFYSSLECRKCQNSIHPEDGYLEYFRQLPEEIDESLGRPLMLGGFATVGALNVEIGHIREESLMGVDDTVKIDVPRVFDPPTDEEMIIHDLNGDEVVVYWGNLLLQDESVFADIEAVDDGTKVGIITSHRDDTEEDIVNVGYHVTYHLPEIDSPPWITMLREAAKNYYRGEGLSARPLLIAACENYLSTELARTLQATGATDSDIEEFFEEHYTWKERAKYGLEEAAGTRLSDYDFDIYDEFAEIKNERDNYLIHVSHEDPLYEVSTEQAKADSVPHKASLLTLP